MDDHTLTLLTTLARLLGAKDSRPAHIEQEYANALQIVRSFRQEQAEKPPAR